MDPRQFVKNSNVNIQRSEPSTNDGLKIGKFHPGMYNVLVNKKYEEKEKRVDLQYILKQKPIGRAQIAPNLSIDLNETKGYYGRFQTGAVHTANFGLKGDLSKNFFSVQLSGYITDGVERKNFTFVIYANGKIRFSSGFLGSRNLKQQPEALRKYIIDTYTQKQLFLYNDIEYNNIAGFFNTNVNFKLQKIASENPLKAEYVSYEGELSPFLYITYKEHKFVLSSKTNSLGSGIVQLQGENDPSDLENAYNIGVEMIKQIHGLGYTMGLVNRNVNAPKLPVVKRVKASTCPKPRRPPCKEGYEVRKNPQGSDCCFKVPKKRSKTKTKNISISYDKNGIMKIGGRKCDRLTKPVLLEVAKKLGVVGVKQKNTKQTICAALDAIEKGTSNHKINGKLCRSMKKEQLITLALSKGIPVNDGDTIKVLCDKLQNKPNTPNTPNSLANEMEQVLVKRNRNIKNKKRRLNDSSIKNDIVKLYGKKWMSKYGSVMDLNKNVREVKTEINKAEKNKSLNVTTSNGIIKKMVANDIKKAMVKNWMSNQEKNLKRKLIEKEANKLYGKFGKNVVNNVVKYVSNLPKTPPLNSNKVKNYIKIKRELQQKSPLALKNKRKNK
jgi:TusA-related sulfurtransferase